MIRLSKLFVLLVALVVSVSICRAEESVIKEFKARKGELKKTSDELPWLLETEKGSAVALGKLVKPVTGKATIKLKIQTASKIDGSIRNGNLMLKSSDNRIITAGIAIGSKKYGVSGQVVKSINKNDAKMNQTGVFDLSVTVDFSTEILIMAVNGEEIGITKIKDSFKDIAEVGFSIHQTATKFSDISIDNK